MTQDPVLVAMAVFAQQLPWLLVALPAGAWLDRLDRRRVVMLVDLARAALVGAFTFVAATGTVSRAVLYVVLFLVGVAEVVADNASSALVPTVVSDNHLPRAYARLGAAFLVSNQLVGPPVGAWLFAAGAAWAFGLEATTFVVAALLLAGMLSAEFGRPIRYRRPGLLRYVRPERASRMPWAMVRREREAWLPHWVPAPTGGGWVARWAYGAGSTWSGRCTSAASKASRAACTSCRFCTAQAVSTSRGPASACPRGVRS